MVACFQMFGMVLWIQEWLKISVMACRAIGPRCFR